MRLADPSPWPLSPQRPPTRLNPCRRSCWRWCCWTWRPPTRPTRRLEPTARSTSRCGRARAAAHGGALRGLAPGSCSRLCHCSMGRPACVLWGDAATCCTLCIFRSSVSVTYWTCERVLPCWAHAVAGHCGWAYEQNGGAALPGAMRTSAMRKRRHITLMPDPLT